MSSESSFSHSGEVIWTPPMLHPLHAIHHPLIPGASIEAVSAPQRLSPSATSLSLLSPPVVVPSHQERSLCMTQEGTGSVRFVSVPDFRFERSSVRFGYVCELRFPVRLDSACVFGTRRSVPEIHGSVRFGSVRFGRIGSVSSSLLQFLYDYADPSKLWNDQTILNFCAHHWWRYFIDTHVCITVSLSSVLPFFGLPSCSTHGVHLPRCTDLTLLLETQLTAARSGSFVAHAQLLVYNILSRITDHAAGSVRFLIPSCEFRPRASMVGVNMVLAEYHQNTLK